MYDSVYRVLSNQGPDRGKASNNPKKIYVL